MRFLTGYETKGPVKWLAVVMALAMMVQGSFISASTMICHTQGTTKVMSTTDECCSQSVESPEHCLTDQCCDIKVSSKQVYAQQRDSESSIDFERVLSAIPTHAIPGFVANIFSDSPNLPIPDIPPLTARMNIQNVFCQYRL